MDTDSKTVYSNSQERGLQVKLTAILCFFKNQHIIEMVFIQDCTAHLMLIML